jgi:hypothetical protein
MRKCIRQLERNLEGQTAFSATAGARQSYDVAFCIQHKLPNDRYVLFPADERRN